MTAIESETATSNSGLSPADRFMFVLLRLPRDPSAVAASKAAAQAAFQKSIVISGARCLLTYIVLPFIAPFVGMAARVGAPLGIAVALVAMVSIVISLRRFFGSMHPRRWAYGSLAGLMFAFLIVTIIIDIGQL
jgi:hypothetical protein